MHFSPALSVHLSSIILMEAIPGAQPGLTGGFWL